MKYNNVEKLKAGDLVLVLECRTLPPRMRQYIGKVSIIISIRGDSNYLELNPDKPFFRCEIKKIEPKDLELVKLLYET